MIQLDGVDSSHYQTLNGQPFPPLGFATHKASEGVGTDHTFQQFIAEYRRAKIPATGAYHFLSPHRTAAEQFATFKAQCASVDGCDLYQIDWEATVENGVNVFPALQTVLDFESMCRRQWGEKVLMYSAPWVTSFYAWHARADRAPLWLADYSADSLANAHKLGAVVLQYSSTVGVSGWTAPGDGNTIIDHAAFATITGTTPAKPQPQIPETDVQPFIMQSTSSPDPSRPDTLIGLGSAHPVASPEEIAGLTNTLGFAPVTRRVDPHTFDLTRDLLSR